MASNGVKSEMVRRFSNSLCIQPSICNSACAVKCWKWDVDQIIMNKPLNNVMYGILILNRPIPQNPAFMKRLWNKAAVRMTVDGGTRQWDKFVGDLPDDLKKNIKNPDLISGDFDSITDEILDKYKKKGCKIIHTPDQNYTDFTKALIELNIHTKQVGLELIHVLAIGQTSGRLDQIIANIQTLYLVKEQFLMNPETHVFLIYDDSISWLLYPGDHVIYVPEETRKHKRAWCSLVPIGETCQYVTSTGLKWNLDNQALRFGGIVSTSNTFDGSQKVTVKCSHTLLWSMRVPHIMFVNGTRFVQFCNTCRTNIFHRFGVYEV